MHKDSENQLTRFFENLSSSKSRVLMLDYDGTLAPFVKDRDHAVPYPGVIDRLTRIQTAGHTRLIMVSGRSIADLTRLLEMKPPLEMFGSHGWEHRRVSGTYHPPEVTPEVQTTIKTALAWVRDSGFSEHCEPKPAGLALHWRGIGQSKACLLRQQFTNWWHERASREAQLSCDEIDLHEFDGGLELRATGRDKGDAVRKVVAESPPETLTAFLGDDATDEDAFREIAAPGLPVLVRPEYRETVARAWIQPPEGLLSFLARWHRCATIAMASLGRVDNRT